MIIVTCERAPCGRFYFSSKGHAAVAEGEVNRICAAASMLSFTLAECWRQSGSLVRAVQEDGCLLLTAVADKCARCAWEVTATGYRLLAEQYPQQVHLVENKKTWLTLEPCENTKGDRRPEAVGSV